MPKTETPLEPEAYSMGMDAKERALASIAISLRRLADSADYLIQFGEDLRGPDGAKRVAAYGLLIKEALDADEITAEQA
jgi:hypothetical protein